MSPRVDRVIDNGKSVFPITFESRSNRLDIKFLVKLFTFFELSGCTIVSRKKEINLIKLSKV